ncbi:MAG: FtsX-like permease family protein [Muribaculaceae bacterium]|nr:FtsX-like permease family protein [Muribaculaceae bacterium]
MSVTIWISKRLRLSGSSGEKRSAGAVIAVVGVALAVMVMEITLAVVAGFKSEISRKIMGFDAQITIGRPYDYDSGLQAESLTVTPALNRVIANGLRPGTTMSLALQLPAMIKTDTDFSGVVFIGHDKEHDYTFEQDNIIEGAYPQEVNDGTSEIVISKHTANQLQLNLKDKVYIYFFVDGSLKTRRATIGGIYDSNLSEYDKMVAYASMNFLQSVMGTDSITGTQLEFTGIDIADIDTYAVELQQALGEAMQTGELDAFYPVTTVLQSGAIYFNWLSLLDTNVVVIFVLMLCVALFTLVSSLYLIILDRIPTIGLLKSMGASRKWLVRLFVSLGMRLALIGIIIGNFIGVGVCFIQMITGFAKLNPEMYYLSEVPIKIDILPFVALNIGVIVVAYLILFIPARSAAKIDPTESIRFE